MHWCDLAFDLLKSEGLPADRAADLLDVEECIAFAPERSHYEFYLSFRPVLKSRIILVGEQEGETYAQLERV